MYSKTIKITEQEANEILLEEKKPLTGKQIWEIAKEKDYVKLVSTQGKTPEETMRATIYYDIRDNKKSPFIRVSLRPSKFFLKDQVSKSELEKLKKEAREEIEEKTPTQYTERDLHPLLTYYVNKYMAIYTKTIYHEKSQKKTFSQWNHPDLIGVNFRIDDWDDNVLELSKELGKQSVSLYSYEMKKELRFSNLRESFFQTVSNSSWANEGYLVAAEISEEGDFRSELKRLSTSFGIGIIKIDVDDPDSSEILYPAKFKTELDWEMINKMVDLNPDFGRFIKRIKNDFRNKEIIKGEYDKTYKIEELKKKLSQY